MEFSDLLLWTAGGILMIVALQSLGSWKTDRGGLKVVVAIVVCTVACSYFVPAGYVLGALVLGMVILPSVAHARALADLEAGRYGPARTWSYVMQLLLPRRDVRQAMMALRALCVYRSGAATDADHLAQGLDPVQRDQLLLHIAIDEYRWADVAVVLDRLPEPLASSAMAWVVRLRLAYETGDYLACLPAYRAIEARTTNRAQMRLLTHVRRDLLMMTGEAPAVMAMESALRGSTARDSQQLSHAVALWCAGDEAEGRRQVTLLAAPGQASHRVQMAAQRRLAHPPVPAAQLPLELRQLGAFLVRTVPRPLQATPVVATMIGINSVVFVVGQVLTSVAMGHAPTESWEDVYERVLLSLGALTPSLCTVGHEWWRLLTTAFLHANILHIAMNMFGLAMLGPTVERRLGWARFLVLYLLSGLVGNAVFCLLATMQGANPTVVGASGCIMGIVGGLGAEALIDWRAGRAPPRRFGLIIVQILFQVAFDMSHPDVAGSAHLGGLFSGFLVALVMMRTPRPAAPVRR